MNDFIDKVKFGAVVAAMYLVVALPLLAIMGAGSFMGETFVKIISFAVAIVASVPIYNLLKGLVNSIRSKSKSKGK